MSPDRLEQFKLVGFFWNFDDAFWSKGFDKLRQYKEANGDCLVPATHITIDGFKLGSWVRNQRSRKNGLSPEQVEKLNALDFSWGIRKNNNQ